MELKFSNLFTALPEAVKFILLPVFYMLLLYVLIERVSHPMFDLAMVGAALSLAVSTECVRIVFKNKGTSLIFRSLRK